VEFTAGAIFVLIFYVFPPLSALAGIVTLIQIIVACLLLVISVYDIKHKIIPDSMAYSLDAVAFISLFIGGSSWWHMPSLSALLAGPILALPFALLWLVSKGTWMGLGDSKLILGLGWLLGISGGVNALVLAFWIAAVASVIWLYAVYGKFRRKTEIPFGPYLIIGFYLVLLFNIQVIDVHLLKDIVMSYF
jgi:prepilin signal peptidase PulO-like enzyme (type II secretory pathway)